MYIFCSSDTPGPHKHETNLLVLLIVANLPCTNSANAVMNATTKTSDLSLSFIFGFPTCSLQTAYEISIWRHSLSRTGQRWKNPRLAREETDYPQAFPDGVVLYWGLLESSLTIELCQFRVNFVSLRPLSWQQRSIKSLQWVWQGNSHALIERLSAYSYNELPIYVLTCIRPIPQLHDRTYHSDHRKGI